jgi:hypothetical protein
LTKEKICVILKIDIVINWTRGGSMKKRDLYYLKEVLSKDVFLKAKDTKLLYFTLRNLRVIEDEIKVLEEVKKPSEAYIEYEKERIELCKKHAKKDEQGNPIIEQNRYVFDNINEFNIILAELITKHKSATDEYDKQYHEFSKLLDEENDISFYKINLEKLPKDLGIDEMTVLMYVIEE